MDIDAGICAGTGEEVLVDVRVVSTSPRPSKASGGGDKPTPRTIVDDKVNLKPSTLYPQPYTLNPIP